MQGHKAPESIYRADLELSLLYGSRLLKASSNHVLVLAVRSAAGALGRRKRVAGNVSYIIQDYINCNNVYRLVHGSPAAITAHVTYLDVQG